MRQGGKINAQILKMLAEKAVQGVSAKQLADIAAAELKRLGGEAAFLNYQGFPDVLCVSVNEAVVHGIPGAYKFRAGDVVGLDFGVRYRGLITDAAITVVVDGPASAEVERLVTVTKEALDRGVGAARAGTRVGDISQAIEAHLRADKLGVIESLVGHGVGTHVHEPPEIPNFGPAGRGPKLKAGMTIAIEPMATLGGKEVYLEKDGWTVKTSDGSIAAHFEHTVLVTESGAEVLTQV